MSARLSFEEVLPKARAYCARQERCQQELRDKLYAWGVHREEVESTIAQLISEGFLNELRYAEHYAVSKFRQKGWGRRKIRQALKLKQVSEPCVRQGLDAIDGEEYRAFLGKAVEKLMRKWGKEKEFVQQQRVKRYLAGRGFEPELVEAAMAGDA